MFSYLLIILIIYVSHIKYLVIFRYCIIIPAIIIIIIAINHNYQDHYFGNDDVDDDNYAIT